MIRAVALLAVVGSLSFAQDARDLFLGTEKAFLHAVDALKTRTANGQLIDPGLRLQEEIGIASASASAVLAAVGEYKAEADKIERQLGSSIFARRLQIAGEYKVTYSPEIDLVNWANLDLNLFLLERMSDLESALGEGDSAKLTRFIEDRGTTGLFFPLRPGENGSAGSWAAEGWKKSPLAFWRESVKQPLLGADGEARFVSNYADAVLPPEDVVPYLEGTVVSVTPDGPEGRQVLLAMEPDGSAQVALIFDAVAWELTREPTVGAVVQFRGIARKFTADPFLILMEPERVWGLPITTTRPNPPFSTPRLAR